MQALAGAMRRPRAEHGGVGAGGIMSYELLIEEREPIDGWMICTVCLNLDRPARVARARWRCVDCGVDAGNNSQRTLRDYLTENPAETLEKNLREWSAVKGTRAAYKMLRAARYKCLLTLGKRLRGAPAVG
jgi:hypothetical protein